MEPSVFHAIFGLGIYDSLVTTDEVNGFDMKEIEKVIDEIIG